MQPSPVGSSWSLLFKNGRDISPSIYRHYKIIRQVLNVSLKASLKTIIAKMDSFSPLKRESRAIHYCCCHRAPESRGEENELKIRR